MERVESGYNEIRILALRVDLINKGVCRELMFCALTATPKKTDKSAPWLRQGDQPCVFLVARLPRRWISYTIQLAHRALDSHLTFESAMSDRESQRSKRNVSREREPVALKSLVEM